MRMCLADPHSPGAPTSLGRGESGDLRRWEGVCAHRATAAGFRLFLPHSRHRLRLPAPHARRCAHLCRGDLAGDSAI
eukprot:47336-Alexandrium_andersonii.AAC.1